ncbi:hypothetical protein KM043_006064 [Ampulex compressa]|nr:hypothetical protein KM043_006064 [Ampulex compressa]
MDSVAMTVPLRQPMKKMKKRKELDALAPPHAISRRGSGKRSSQELLTESSDERSEYWNVSSRGGRKCRGRRSRTCPGFLKACSAFLACASVLATASLIWLFIDVRQQLTSLRTELDQAIAGSEAVPDALQKCHSLSRDLQNNQTIIFSQLYDLKGQINNFTIQLADIQGGLRKVQEWFRAAPKLASVPDDLKALSSSVLSFGSQIRDLGVTVNTLKKANAKVQDIQAIVQSNISSIQHSVSELTNVTRRPEAPVTDELKIKTARIDAAILQLRANLSHVNETLSRTLKWAADDQKQDHSLLVALEDKTQNVSMKAIALENECAKLSEQTALMVSVEKLADQIKDIQAEEAKINEKMKRLEETYESIRNSTNAVLAGTVDKQEQRQVVKENEVEGESGKPSLTMDPDHDTA